MGRLRVRSSASAFLSIALLLLGGSPESHAPVLCVHADGEAALETGTDPCCLPVVAGGRAAHRPDTLEADPGGCPGCTDVVLSAASQQPPRSRQGKPQALLAGIVTSAPTAQRARVAEAFLISPPKADSPPLVLPLRI